MKDYDQVFKDMDNVYKEMNKVMEQMNKTMEDAFNTARKIVKHPWKPWFAWYPVRVHGNRVWLKKIYRRSINTYVDMDDWSRYEYGTVFDVIKDAE